MQKDNGPSNLGRNLVLRTELRPGDIGWVIRSHGVLYAREWGFDHTFEAYVARPLAEFAISASARDRIWLAEHDGRIVGCIGIVGLSLETAQLRWFLVEPDARGAGLGERLLHDSITFCKERGYTSVILWTVSSLVVAGHLYQNAGFKKVEVKAGRRWGVDVVEEKYELKLARGD